MIVGTRGAVGEMLGNESIDCRVDIGVDSSFWNWGSFSFVLGEHAFFPERGFFEHAVT
jgi:hypothetical protein